MSFLTNYGSTPLITSKITAIGRQKIASGQLNFKYFVFGDSQIDYKYNNNNKLLFPKDRQPNVKSFLTTVDCNPYNELEEIKVLECCYHNPAKDRGFFNFTNNSLNLTSNYIKTYGTVQSQQLNGSKEINIGTGAFNDGDLIVLQLANNVTGTILASSTTTPVPYLTYQITKNGLSGVIGVDRPLPYLPYSGTTINYYIYDKDIETYRTSNAEINWDYETLNFKEECLEEDVLVWNFNIVYNEDMIGIHDNQVKYYENCSYNYAGQKEYLGYNIDCPDDTSVISCGDNLVGIEDDFVRGIGILHFSNQSKKNFYGEHFFISPSTPLVINYPTIMWHRKNYTTGTGTIEGMKFKSDTVKKNIDNTNIEYYDLIEDATLIASGSTAMAVGRVFPQLQIVTIHNGELLATLSYKSNRNYSLPKLKGKMVSSNGNAILPKGKTLYVTYTLDSLTGIQNILPQQKYLKFVNNSTSGKDIEFSLEDINLLPYMRQKESMSYDGYGFYAHSLKLLYQIVDTNDRPLSDGWRAIDYTNNYLTNFNGNTINPIRFETQNPSLTGFVINEARINTSTEYDISVLGVPDDICPTVLGFGCENIMFGNFEVEIGACAYKSILEITLDSDQIVKSTNPTWESNKTLKLSEIGIYDADKNLVWYNSFYQQITINSNSISQIDLEIDF